MISRFAVEDSYFRRSDNSVKWKAFMPDKEGLTSVFRLGALEHAAKIQHGDEHVGKARGKSVLGYAQVPADDILKHGLTIDVDEPPPLHHNIGTWPENLEEQKSLAIAIAEDAIFIPRE